MVYILCTQWFHLVVLIKLCYRSGSKQFRILKSIFLPVYQIMCTSFAWFAINSLFLFLCNLDDRWVDRVMEQQRYTLCMHCACTHACVCKCSRRECYHFAVLFFCWFPTSIAEILYRWEFIYWEPIFFSHYYFLCVVPYHAHHACFSHHSVNSFNFSCGTNSFNLAMSKKTPFHIGNNNINISLLLKHSNWSIRIWCVLFHRKMLI